MGKYVLKRILMMIPTLLAVVFIIFVLINITPGDPGRIMLGQDAAQEDVDAVNAMMHMDKPLVMRYLYYIWDALHLDFGVSFLTRQPVFSELFSKVPVTFTLALGTALASVLIGVPLGVIAAVKEHTLLDSSLTISSLLIAAIPGFWLSIMMILLFSVKLRLLPSSGIGSPLHYVMPILGSSIGNAAYYLRMTRSAMQDALRQEYIKTARAKGAPERTVIWKHALRNALMPVVTQIGMSLGLLICGSVVIEKMFTLPGIGSLIIDRINFKDEPIIIAGVILISICFTVVMLLVDIIYAFIDPRIKAKYSNAKG